jgi:hypothetical protein
VYNLFEKFEKFLESTKMPLAVEVSSGMNERILHDASIALRLDRHFKIRAFVVDVSEKQSVARLMRLVLITVLS